MIALGIRDANILKIHTLLFVHILGLKDGINKLKMEHFHILYQKRKSKCDSNACKI